MINTVIRLISLLRTGIDPQFAHVDLKIERIERDLALTNGVVKKPGDHIHTRTY